MGTDISVSAEGLDLQALNEAPQVESDEHFRNGRKFLRPKVHYAKMISRGCAGIASVDGRMYWASVLFTRMTVISNSILKLVPQVENKDHWDAASICALARNLGECYLWMYFLSFDPVDDEKHQARIFMMYAHDNRGRERIAKEAGGHPDLAEYYRRVRAEIERKLNANRYFTSLSEKRRAELIKGDKTPFIQDDLLDKAGLKRTEFRVNYRVLSAQTHSSPVAFYDVLTIGGGAGVAHDREMKYMGIALELTNEIIDLAISNMFSMHPYAERRGQMLSEKDIKNGKHIGFPIPEMSGPPPLGTEQTTPLVLRSFQPE